MSANITSLRTVVLSICVLAVFFASDVFAQSGYRGSSSRSSGSRSAPSSRAMQGRPSRMGPARSTAVPQRSAPTGILNTVRPGRPSSSGSGMRSLSGPSLGSRPAVATPSTSGRYSATPIRGSRKRSPKSPGSYTGSARKPSGAAATISKNGNGYRTWTDASGKYQIQGQLAAYQNGIVWLRRSDGLISKLPIRQLSQADQSFVVNSASPL